jgi:tRNA(fMet)-specific endonuclease VapC
VYLLDTNISVALLKQNALAVEKFNTKARFCYLSTIVVAELYKGVYCSQRRWQNLSRLVRKPQKQAVQSFETKL